MLVGCISWLSLLLKNRNVQVPAIFKRRHNWLIKLGTHVEVAGHFRTFHVLVTFRLAAKGKLEWRLRELSHLILALIVQIKI